jgi:hypothetical protein
MNHGFAVEIPKTKFQISNKFQIPIPNDQNGVVWNFEL